MTSSGRGGWSSPRSTYIICVKWGGGVYQKSMSFIARFIVIFLPFSIRDGSLIT